METWTIPEEEWIKFFDDFSRDHAGWVATIEVLDTATGHQRIAKNLPLLGISFDTKGTRGCSVEVGAGDRPDQHISHIVDMPLHIRETREAEGCIDLQIEPATGPVTLVHLQGPVH
jgi:hypothetical protein